MKEIQTPKKNFLHSSESGNRRSKDFQPKNRRFAEKRFSAPFSDVSSESTKDPVDSAPIREISEAVSDCDTESVAEGLSFDLLASPEKFSLVDVSPVSTITNVERNRDVSDAVHSLRVEVDELKKLILPSDAPEERSRIEEIVVVKCRVVFLCFLLWAVLAFIIVLFKSGEQDSYVGPLPT